MMIFVLCLLLIPTVFGGFCDGNPNTIPFYTDPPKLLKQVPNGKKMTVGSDDHNSTITIVHLWGSTERENGEIYGTLLKTELALFFLIVDVYIHEEFVPSLPKELREWVKEQGGIDSVLDMVYEKTKPYTPQYFYDYMEGVAATSDVDYLLIRRFNMIPQLIKALPPDSACTLIGSSGKATPTGNIVQLRALDIGSQNTIIFAFPLITVHHYNDSNPIVNILAVGSFGMLSGYTPNLSISTKVWVTPEKMTEIIPGTVWNFQFYDAMRKHSSVDGVIKMLENSQRTMSTYIGFGDHKENKFYGIKYRVEDVTVLTWANQSTYEYHPQYEDVVYWDKSMQPSHHPCLGDLLGKYHDKQLSAENIVRYIGPIHETGDAQSIVYDWNEKKVYVAFGFLERTAYASQHVVLDMMGLFEEKKP